jgi:hypothetical protein
LLVQTTYICCMGPSHVSLVAPSVWSSLSSAIDGSAVRRNTSVAFSGDISVVGFWGGSEDNWIGEEETKNAEDVACRLVIAFLTGVLNGSTVGRWQ